MLRTTLAALALSASFGLAQAQAPALDPQNTIVLDTKDGRVTIKLRPDLAPKHVEQIKALTKRGFYDGIVFHRVIDGFMAQTGDPRGDGTGGSDLPNIPAEFSCGSLTGQYTLFGEVVSGMEAVRKIKKGSSSNNGAVSSPDKIIRMRLLADAK